MSSKIHIPKEFKQRLLDVIRPSELIGRFVRLERAGVDEYKACCPFHEEKTPSFTVSDRRGFYHCFGCGAHGDVVGFLMENQKMQYPEAVEYLASMAGLEMPKPVILTEKQEEQRKRARDAYDVMEEACGFFVAQLDKAAHAKQYCRQRGIEGATQRHFRIGYAPAHEFGATSTFLEHMRKRGYSDDMLQNLGLAGKAQSGGLYPRFAGRLMFPIHDGRGRVIAFGGRVIEEDPSRKQAKYINSPQTELFNKGRELFNLHNAREAARSRGRLIVAEGYMDVVALTQAGFAESVAPLGTALTEEQAALMWRYCPEPVLCLDGDMAGKRAMARAAVRLLPHITPERSLRFAFLPHKMDPDDVLRNHGARAMEDIISSGVPLSRALLEVALVEAERDSAHFSSPEEEAAIATRMTQLADLVAHPQLKQSYKTAVREQIYKMRQARFGRSSYNRPAARSTGMLNADARTNINIRSSAQTREAQMFILSCACVPDLLENPEVDEAFLEITFGDESLDRLKEAFYDEVLQRQEVERATTPAGVLLSAGDGRSELQQRLINALVEHMNLLPTTAARITLEFADGSWEIYKINSDMENISAEMEKCDDARKTEELRAQRERMQYKLIRIHQECSDILEGE